MSTIPCAIIKDILPLYIDGELSDESRSLVESHVTDCQMCQHEMASAKHEGALDFSLIPETLPAASTYAAWMKRLRKTAVFMFGVFAIVIALVGVYTFSLGRNAVKYLTITKVNNEAQLETFLYDNIPGLQRAESLGHVTYPEQELSFTGFDADLRLEKLWYTREMVYIVYSIGGYVPDQLDEIIALMRHGQYPLTSNAVRVGAMYQNRYYSFFPLYNQKEIVNPTTEKTTLDFSFRAAMVLPGDYTNPQEYNSEETVVTVAYDPAWDEPVTLPLQGSLSLSEGKMILHALEITPTQTYLYLDFNHLGGDTLDAVSGWLTVEGEKRHFFSVAEPSDQHATLRLTLDALDVVPSSFTLEIERAALVSGEHVEFTIDASSYQAGEETTKEPKQFLKEIRNTRIYLEQLYADKRGISFTLIYEPQGKLREPYSEMITNGFTDTTGSYYSYGMLRDKPSLEFLADNPLYYNRRWANVVSAVNEKGDPGTYGQTGSGPGLRMSMFLDSTFVESSDTIHVTVNNLAYVLVGHWEKELTVNK